MQTLDTDMSETDVIGKYGSLQCQIIFKTEHNDLVILKPFFNSLTPDRHHISGQRGSKPRVSEHESSAPPVNMYGTTSRP